jgi:tetratricopeptide (TPR) repeat protein
MSARSAARAAIAFAAASRAAYVLHDLARSPLAAFPIHDAARYDAWARAIASGASFEPGAFSQAPLYPFLLGGVYALCGAHAWIVFVLQAASGVAAIALTARAARHLAGERAGAWAAWLLALFAPLAFFETKLLPAALTVLLAAALTERASASDASDHLGGTAAAGALCGLLTVASASFLPALALFPAWIAWGGTRPARVRVARAALFVAAAVAVVAPVTVRNRIVSGDWVLVTTNGGITFWQGNNPAAEGVFATPDGFTGSIATQRDEARRIASEASGGALSDAGASAYWFARGRAYLAGEPARAAALVARKAMLAIADSEQPLVYSPRLDANPLRRLAPLPFAAALALAAAGLILRHPTRADGPALILAAVPAATLVVFFVASRYRLPALPALAVLAGRGAAEFTARTGTARRRHLAIGAAMALAVVSFAWAPCFERDLTRRQDAMSFDDLGNALRGVGRPAEALASFARSIALDPAPPFAFIDRAKALAALGRSAEAEASLREAVRSAPDLAEGQFELGVVLFESGRLDEAASRFARAFSLEPNADAGNNLAASLLRLGRAEEAREAIRAMRSRGLAVDAPLARAAFE